MYPYANRTGNSAEQNKAYSLIKWALGFVFTATFCAFGFSGDFLSEQKQYPRVRQALSEKTGQIDRDLQTAGLKQNNFKLLIRVFKQEAELELFVCKNTEESYRLLKTFPVCAKSGIPGPKMQKGDGQVPEGCYKINRFNPTSSFYLSLGLDYPNAADKKRCKGRDPGGDIFIHGNCVTIGCIPLGDDKIKTLYLYALLARNSGQQSIPVYIFPFRMEDKQMKVFSEQYKALPEVLQFWQALRPAYLKFEQDKKVLHWTSNEEGAYLFN
ncbi:MAG TPA: L,D-transpeptidase family protein [Bacteroidia bacterium]|nr:L,D-transpeptidase family protein [Bacteroidia bacterium]